MNRSDFIYAASVGAASAAMATDRGPTSSMSGLAQSRRETGQGKIDANDPSLQSRASFCCDAQHTPYLAICRPCLGWRAAQ